MTEQTPTTRFSVFVPFLLPPSPTPIKGAPVPRLSWHFSGGFSTRRLNGVSTRLGSRDFDLGYVFSYLAAKTVLAHIRRQVGPSNLEMCSYATRARIHLPFEKGHGGPTRRAKIADKPDQLKKTGDLRTNVKAISRLPDRPQLICCVK